MKKLFTFIVLFLLSVCLYGQTQARTMHIDSLHLEDIPINFEDFTKELLNILDEFAEKEKLTKEIKCIPYTYRPSNYFRDEINAYIETEKAHHYGLFNTSEKKLNKDKKIKTFYEIKMEQSIKYESNNNYNTTGYENK